MDAPEKSPKALVFNVNPELKFTKIALEIPGKTKDVQSEFVEFDLSTIVQEDSSSEATTIEDIEKDIKPGQIKVDGKQERLALGLPTSFTSNPITGSTVKLHASWTSDLTGSMMGYYKSSWHNPKTNKDEFYALTQFEPTAARRAYPCWDEPALKSTYNIALVSRTGTVNLSNMPAVEEKKWDGKVVFQNGVELGQGITNAPESEWTLTKFEKTPLISSYLVAWANGEFEHLEDSYKSPLTGKTIPLRIYTTPDNIHQAAFGLEVKKRTLPVYEEVFDIPYPLPKLDTLVVSDFDAGAMENWGLITGRTSAYLFDEKKSSLAAKKRIIDVQSHEVSHQWFGNIVTMYWWDNLWLNEAFATLMGEVIIPDRIYKEFNVRQEFLTSHLSAALGLDALRSSHPIECPCPSADDVNQIFDSISYSKGGSVLNMLAQFAGEDKFLKGVSNYLKKHLYANGTTKDLWDGISGTTGIDVAKMMSNWTLKTGYPVVLVDTSGPKVKITQQRFLNTGDVKPEEDETIWQIPLFVKTSKGLDKSALLTERETTLDLDSSEIFKLNGQTAGVYRVAYSPEHLAKISSNLDKFSVEDKIGLVSDSFTLAQAGLSKTSAALTLADHLDHETEYRIYEGLHSSIGKLRGVWWEASEEVRNAIHAYMIKLFSPIHKKLGWEFKDDEEPAVKQLRALAITTLAAAEEKATIQEVQRRFQPFLESGDDSLIHPDTQRCIYTIAVRHGGEKEWQKIRDVYANPPNPSTKIDALMALGATKNESCLNKAFDMINDGSVKSQDTMYPFAALSGNRLAVRKTAQYFMDHYDELVERFANNFGMTRLVSYAFGGLTSKKDLQWVDSFFEGKDVTKYKLALAQTRDKITGASNWLERDSADVEQWLKDNKYIQ